MALRLREFGPVALATMLAGCGDTANGPLIPPPDELRVALRDSAYAGEMTWIAIHRPATDTGEVLVESSNPAVLSIDGRGRVFPHRPGTVTVSARSAQHTSSATLQIRTRADSFAVRYRFTWTPSAAELALFDHAAMRWQRVLRAAAPVTIPFPAGGCHPSTQAETITQQGITIFVDRFDDGSVAPGVTGTAGPCVIDSNGKSHFGVLTLARSFSSRVAGMSSSELATWENQFVQQLGSALGLAGLSVPGVPLAHLDLTDPNQPTWTGPRALAAYRMAGGGAAGVPVTANRSAWRTDLGTEGDVMTGPITPLGRISAVSIGALIDRGHPGDESRAEPAPPPSASPRPSLLVLPHPLAPRLVDTKRPDRR